MHMDHEYESIYETSFNTFVLMKSCILNEALIIIGLSVSYLLPKKVS